MAVLPKTTPNVAASMEKSKANRSIKRPRKASSDAKPAEDDAQRIESKTNKKKKRQATSKLVQSRDDAGPDAVEAEEKSRTEHDSVTAKEDDFEGPKQGICIVPSGKRFLLLHSFLKRNLSKKVVVICSSSKEAKFYRDLLRHLKIDSAYFHGKADKEKGISSVDKFSMADSGVLFTDIPVDDLEVSDEDWIVQYDAPDIQQGYSSTKENILTFLTPNELLYLDHLKNAKVQVVEYKFENKKLLKGEPQLEKLVAKNHHLYTTAVQAYRSYIKAYHQRSMKDVFNVDLLDLLAVAKDFCFSNPPKVHLD